ncbi:MAG: hypothetical protein Q9P01_07925 [Anaerolineae bacterium]|nr:hypothetical protein [Anaerolineae bacterium]
MMNEDSWNQTVVVAIDGAVITEEPSMDAFRTDLVEQALAILQERDADVDLTGEDWERVEVTLTPGGE